MTDREAIEVLRMDCDLITFDPMTGEIIDLETVKLRNDLNYKCYLANKVAISALQEREERSKGCRYCSCGADMKNDEDMEMDLFNYAEGMDFSVYPNYCPMCGRPLEGTDNETD